MLATLGRASPDREGLMAQSSKGSAKGPGRPFQKGQSGNPGGRPKDVVPIKELAKQHTQEAIDALVGALCDENGRTRVAAAEAMLDRACGSLRWEWWIIHRVQSMPAR